MQRIHNVKVVLLGDSGVGKTNIALRFVSDTFNESSASTVIVTTKSKIVKVPKANRAFKISVWDTAGQEKYRSIGNMYYKDAQAAILVYDITKKETFDGVKVWMSECVNNAGSDRVIVIVGNKCDLIEEEKVTYEEAKSYADSLNALFFVTSAKDGTNVNQVFLAICSQLVPELKDNIRAMGGTIESVSDVVNSKVSLPKKVCC